MEAFIQLTFSLLIIFVLARLGTFLAKRFDIPSITIQLLIGILLGPSLLNILGNTIVVGTWGSVSPNFLHSVLKILAEIGLIQLMFLGGLEVNWHELKKILKPPLSVGIWGFILTAVSVTVITRVFVDHWAEAMAVSAIMSGTSFGISIYYFSEMKALGSRLAIVVSGIAILSGLLVFLLMIGSQATNYAMIYGTSRMTLAVSWLLGKLIMFFLISYFLTSRFLKLAAKIGFEKRPRQMLVGYLLLVSSLYAWAAMHFGSFAAVGVACLGGGLLAASNLEVKDKIAKGFESVLASISVGILLMVIGMEVNLKAVKGSVVFLTVLLTAVIGAKLVGILIARHRTDESLSDRLLLAIGILPQGEMGILIAAYLFSRGLIDPSRFGAVVTLVVMLTMFVPVLMKIAFAEWSRKEVSVASPFTGGKERDGWQ